MIKKSLTLLVCFLTLLVNLYIFTSNSSYAQDQKDREEELINTLTTACRSAKLTNVNARIEIIRMFLDVKEGKLDAENFYKKLGDMEMPDGKEHRHILMKIKKDIINYLGKDKLAYFLGEPTNAGGSKVEQIILSHRRKVVMDTIKEAITILAKDNPKFTVYYAEIGSWPDETPDQMKFASDIDFNFLCGDLETALKLKKIFDSLIKKRFKLTPEQIDMPCTVLGKATPEVYMAHSGQSYAEKNLTNVQKISFGEESEPGLESKKIDFADARLNMLMEAEISTDPLIDLEKAGLPDEPGTTLEMIRHFEHDIVKQNVYTDLEAFVKAAKYAGRSFDAQITTPGDESNITDKHLYQFTKDLKTDKTKPEKLIKHIKKYFDDIDQPLPFEVDLTTSEKGKPLEKIKANEKLINAFWDKCRKTMWDNANTKMKAITADLNTRTKNLSPDDIEVAKALYEDIYKYNEMVEISNRILTDEKNGIHDRLDKTYQSNLENFRNIVKEFKQKIAQNDLLKYVDPEKAKQYQWVEESLKTNTDISISMVWAGLLNVSGGINDTLDYVDNKMLNQLRYGQQETYENLLKSGENYYYQEKAEKLLKQQGVETSETTQEKIELNNKAKSVAIAKIQDFINGKLETICASRGIKLLKNTKDTTVSGIQTINNSFNESVNSVPEGRFMMQAMMLYNLKEELPLYAKHIGNRDWEGLAVELFKRRIPGGSAVEKYYMGDNLGAAWDATATLIPPLNIASAASAVGAYVMQSSLDAQWDEKVEFFIDKLYKGAEFEPIDTKKVGDNIEVTQWKLISLTSNNKKYNFEELLQKEMTDAKELNACLDLKTSQERDECGIVDVSYDGLFESIENRDAFVYHFEKSDVALQFINELIKDKNIGPKMKDKFMLQRFARLEDLKVVFLKHLKKELEERKAGEQTMINGQLADMNEELMTIADELDIRPQIQSQIDDKFGGKVSQFLTSLKDDMQSAIRYMSGEKVEIWDIQKELSAFITKNLVTYKQIIDNRTSSESEIPINNQDEGLRILTGPYFLKGIPENDLKTSKTFSGLPEKIKKEMIDTLSTIKAESGIKPSTLELDKESFDKDILDKLTYHGCFKDIWKHVNSVFPMPDIQPYLGQDNATQLKPEVFSGLSDQDRAIAQFKQHSLSIDKLLSAYKQHCKEVAEESKEDQNEKTTNKEENKTTKTTESLKDEEKEEKSEEGVNESKEEKTSDKSQTAKSNLIQQIEAIKNKLTGISGQIDGLIVQINTNAEKVDQKIQQVKRLEKELDPKLIQSKEIVINDSLLWDKNKMQAHLDALKSSRETIKKESLAICSAYERMKATENVDEIQKIMEDIETSSKKFEASYNVFVTESSDLNMLRHEIFSVISQIDSIDRYPEQQNKFKEAFNILKECLDLINSIDNMMLQITEQQKSAIELEKNKDSIMNKVDTIKDSKEKQTLYDLQSQITTIMKNINEANLKLDVVSTLDKKNLITEAVRNGEKELNSSPVSVVTTSSRTLEEVNALIAENRKHLNSNKDIVAAIIEDNNKAQACINTSMRTFLRKTSPEKQVEQKNCTAFPGTKPQWVSSAQEVKCVCPNPDETFNSELNRCASQYESLLPGYCNPYPGTKGKWNAQTKSISCECTDPNKQFDTKLNRCATNIEIKVANTSCSAYPGTVATWSESEQKVYCNCPDYNQFFNLKLNKCVSRKEGALANANCRAYLNSTPVWNEYKQKAECDCQGDYEWNSTRNACRIKKEIQVSRTSCRHIQGTTPRWSEKDGKVMCYCITGSWNGSRCISDYEQTVKKREEERLRQQRQAQIEREQRYKEQQKKTEKRKYCNQYLAQLNNAVRSGAPQWQVTMYMNDVLGAECPFSEYQQASKGQWGSSGYSSNTTNYGNKTGTSGSSSPSHGSGMIIYPKVDCRKNPELCPSMPGGLFGAPE